MSRESVQKEKPTLEGLTSPLLRALTCQKTHFSAHRIGSEVKIDMDGTTIGCVRVDKASPNVGLAFKLRYAASNPMFPIFYAKDGQYERKKVAAICSFMSVATKLRGLEYGRKTGFRIDYDEPGPKEWYEAFSNGHRGEVTEAYAVVQATTQANKYLTDVFAEVSSAIRSALGQDVKEAVERVTNELPFLVGHITAEEWVDLFNQYLVKQVHST